MKKNTVFARAKLESLHLRETYIYEETLASRNPVPPRLVGEGRGEIKAILPYDGYDHFTQQAYQDVQKQVGKRGELEAQIGFLVLKEGETGQEATTNLNELLNSGGRCHSVPLRVPILDEELSSLEQLRGDRHACAMSLLYTPKPPGVCPIRLQIEIDDVLSRQVSRQFVEKDERPIVELPEGLSIRLRAHLHLPVAFKELKGARISRILLGWPSITSLRTVALSHGKGEDCYPILYDPLAGQFCWRNVDLAKPEAEGEIGHICEFTSPDMMLDFQHPGQVYQADELKGRMEIEIPDLLSGLQTRLFDATGRPSKLSLDLSTQLILNFSLKLDGAFSRRPFRPYQFLHFKDVMLNEDRAFEVKLALQDCGLKILSSLNNNGCYQIRGESAWEDGTMNLDVFLSGRTFTVDLEEPLPGGGIERRRVVTGCFWVHLYGEARGETGRVSREMNRINRALRERFSSTTLGR